MIVLRALCRAWGSGPPPRSGRGLLRPVDREAGVGPSPGEQLPEMALHQLMQHVLLAESGDTPRAP